MRSVARRFVSSSYCFRYLRSDLASTFQSRWRSGSPGMYWRCSANSTLNPWYGLRWSPVRNPSTTSRAFKSKRANFETKWGSRRGVRFSVPGVTGGPQSPIGRSVLSVDARRGFEELRDDLEARDAVGLGGEVGD